MGIKPVSFKVSLKVNTPTAVTTGQEYTFFEALFKSREVWIIDFNALIEKLKGQGKLYKLLNLLRGFSPYTFLDLQKFYSENVGKGEAKVILPLEPEVSEFIKRKFDNLSKYLKFDRRRYIRELGKGSIKRIHRNPVTQAPYIPGSSLKGAIRTALLNFLVKEEIIDLEALKRQFLAILSKYGIQRWPASFSNKDISFDFKELKKDLDSLFDSIDRALLCQFLIEFPEGKEPLPFSRDLMRFVKVSDLLPAGEWNVAVGRLKRRSKGGDEISFGFNAIEFVKEGALFEGTITLYPDFIKRYLKCPIEISPKMVVRALRVEYSRVINSEIDFFKKLGEKFSPLGSDRQKYLEDKERVAMVKLGFGAGALSKTLSHAPEVRLVGNARTGIRNTPTTLPVIGGKPLGWCLLEVEKESS